VCSDVCLHCCMAHSAKESRSCTDGHAKVHIDALQTGNSAVTRQCTLTRPGTADKKSYLQSPSQQVTLLTKRHHAHSFKFRFVVAHEVSHDEKSISITCNQPVTQNQPNLQFEYLPLLSFIFIFNKFFCSQFFNPKKDIRNDTRNMCNLHTTYKYLIRLVHLHCI